MKTRRPELSLEENTPLNNFMNAVLKTRFHDRIKDSRDNGLAIEFARSLGYNTRYHDGISRPDTDPRWTDIRWSAGECGMTGLVKNVRVVYLPHCYAQALEELTKDSDVRFPNGERVYDVISSLRRIRKVNKDYAKICRMTMTTQEKLKGDYLRCHDIIGLTKYLLNSLLHIIANYARPTGIGSHHLREVVRNRTAEMIRRINKTDATVIYASYDHVVYVGPQIDDATVHHETHKYAIIIGERGIAYSNDIETFGLPRIRIVMDGEYYFSPLDDAADRCRRVAIYQNGVNKRVSQCKASVAAYLNLTKEDIDRRYAIDSECDSL